MQIQEIVTDVKDRFEDVTETAQDVVKTSLSTVKKVNVVLVDGVQTIARSQQAAAKDLFGAARASFDKARDAGIKEVVAKPVDFLPAGRDVVVAAFEESKGSFTKTRKELTKVVRKGYDAIIVDINGKPTPKVVKKASAATKKAATSTKKAATTVRKTATKSVEKATSAVA